MSKTVIIISCFISIVLSELSAVAQNKVVWIKIWEHDTLTTEIAVSKGLAKDILNTERHDTVVSFGNTQLPLESLRRVVNSVHETFTMVDHKYDTKLKFSTGTFNGFDTLGIKSHDKTERNKEFNIDIFEKGKESFSLTVPVNGTNATMGHLSTKAQSKDNRALSVVESTVRQSGGMIYIKDIKHGTEIYMYRR